MQHCADHDNVVPSAHSIGARQKRCPGLWLQRLCRYANMAQVVVGRLQQRQALVGAQLVVGLLHAQVVAQVVARGAGVPPPPTSSPPFCLAAPSERG